jgi:acyl-CoA reductase-like NAD-dependent aldehyde dehydrogenase
LRYDRPAVEVLQDDETHRVEVHRKARGTVCGITPGNFSLLLGALKFAPALPLGNSFILKPAPTASVTSPMHARLAKDILPGGAFSVVTDLNDLGAALTDHQDVAKISFTGSTSNGKRVLSAAAATLKHITLKQGAPKSVTGRPRWQPGQECQFCPHRLFAWATAGQSNT